ncbi:rho GTPase-activating protein gacJ-like [Palaemon carinicauda]|uniref:rho GTPase-activating protein gacJ-like n=1 Tax=Palaemon carinicauda TaxID=392227 RepID=UPI0035B67201
MFMDDENPLSNSGVEEKYSFIFAPDNTRISKFRTSPATEPVPGTSRDHPVQIPDHPPATQEDVENENNPSQEPPSPTATTGDSKFRLTPGPSITSYAAIVAMEASNPHLNMTIRPNRRGQLNLCSNIPPSSLSRNVKGKPEVNPTNWRPSTRDLALPTYPLAFGAHSAPKSTSRSHFDASGVRSLATTNPAVQVQRSVGFVAADNTPLPTVLPGIKQGTKPSPAALTVEDPIMLGMIDAPTDFRELLTAKEQTATTTSIHVNRVERSHLQLNKTPPSNNTSQQNPNPSRHAIPEPSSPPTLPPAPKPQRPPKPPSKAKRSPTHTLCTPSPLKLTSPTNSLNVTQPKQPEPNPSSSAPITHTSNISHSLREFPSTVTSKSSASRPSKHPLNIYSSKYDLSACPMDALLAAISNILRNFLRSRKIKFTQESLDDFVFDTPPRN